METGTSAFQGGETGESSGKQTNLELKERTQLTSGAPATELALMPWVRVFQNSDADTARKLPASATLSRRAVRRLPRPVARPRQTARPLNRIAASLNRVVEPSNRPVGPARRAAEPSVSSCAPIAVSRRPTPNSGWCVPKARLVAGRGAR